MICKLWLFIKLWRFETSGMVWNTYNSNIGETRYMDNMYNLIMWFVKNIKIFDAKWFSMTTWVPRDFAFTLNWLQHTLYCEHQNVILLGPNYRQPLRKKVQRLDQCVVHSYATLFLICMCKEAKHMHFYSVIVTCWYLSMLKCSQSSN